MECDLCFRPAAFKFSTAVCSDASLGCLWRNMTKNSLCGELEPFYPTTSEVQDFYSVCILNCVAGAFLCYSTTILNSSYLTLLSMTTSTLMFINSSLNPFIYCWKIKNIRRPRNRLVAPKRPRNRLVGMNL